MAFHQRLKRAGMMILLMSFGFAAALAQQVNVRGRVIDGNDKAPIQGVTVIVVGTQMGMSTGEDGSYSFMVDRQAEIRLLFRYVEFTTDTTLVVVTEDGKDSYDVDLITGQRKQVLIDPIVFTANKGQQNVSKLSGSFDVIGPKKVDMQISHDIKDALQQNSGVDIIDGQPSIRGSSGYAYGVGSRVMLMLDGLPLLSPDAGIAQFDMVPTDNIAQIEVMKGASSVLYGSSALGGVINVIMADAPEKPKTSIRLRGAMYDSPRNKALDWDGNKSAKNAGINVFHSHKIGRHDVVGLVDFWHDTGYKFNNSSTQGRAQVLTKFRPKAVPGLTWGINGMMRFDSTSTALFWDSYLPADTLITFGGDTVFNSMGAYSGSQSIRRQWNLRGNIDPYIKYLTPKGNLHSYRGRMMRTANTNDTYQSNYNAIYYNDYNFSTHLLDERLTWVIGGTFSYNTIRGDSVYQGKHKSMNTAGYTQLDGKINEKLSATLGARFDKWVFDDSIVNAAPIFRAGVNYEFTKGSNIRASFGQAFRAPSIAERYLQTNAGGLVIESNPDLKVEKGYSAEIGFRQGFLVGKATRSILGYLDAAGFLMDYHDMIEFGIQSPDTFIFGSVPVFAARNYSHARITGVEVTALAQFTYDKLHFDLNGGITYMNPVNMEPVPDSMQVDLLNTVGPQSSPFTFNALGMVTALNSPDDAPFHREDNPRALKYRSKWLNRLSGTIGYGRWGLTCNYRHKSQILTIDQFLYIGVPGTADWVLSHPKGYDIFDFVFSSQLTKSMQLSLSAKNAFNEEYANLPGNIGEQRSFAFQMKYVF
ncbi:MAG: TonB-dependent receptor [Bacteroidia bacterium]